MTAAEAAAPSCAACASPEVTLVETHRDRHLDRVYRLYLCAACGVVFSEPREAVGADWYQKAVPLEVPSAPEKDARFAAFFELIHEPGTVLDVGCGEGGFLGLARARGWTAVGFDYDERKVAEVNKRGIEAHASDWSAFCSSREEGGFDAVTLFDVLEHVPDPRELIRQVRRLLKPAGKLVATLPNARRPLLFGREDFDFPPHHFTRWTPEAMKGFLEREGFAVAVQRSRTLEYGYFLEIAVLHAAVKPALSAAKRLLFRRDAQESVTELAEGGGLAGPLGDKGLRGRLFGLFHGAAKAALALPCAPLWAYYQAQERGNVLLTVAVKA